MTTRSVLRLSVPGLIVALSTTALLLHVNVLPALPELSRGWLLWVALTLTFVIAERASGHLTIGRQALSCSFSEVPLIVGLAFVDPALVVAASVVAGTLVFAVRYGRSLKLVFNVVHVWLETLLAATVWHLVLGGADAFGPRGWLAAIAVLVATDAYSNIAIGLAMRASGAPPDRQSLHEFTAGSAISFLNVSLGVLLITVIHADWRAAWTLSFIGAALFLAYRSYSALRRRHDTLEQLAGFTAGIDGLLSTEVVAGEVVERAAMLLDTDVVELIWETAELSGAPLVVRHGSFPGSAEALRALAAAEGGPVLVPRDVRDGAARRALEATGMRDAVLVPLHGQDGVRGSLLAGDRIGDVTTFAVDDVRVLQAIANQVTVALANSELADQLRREAAEREHEALHDPLTALPNRRCFQQSVTAALATNEDLAVLLLDLDRFKEVNDTLGHHTGDQLLIEVAARLSSTLRDGGTVARLGGDEFAVLLPGVDDLAAAATAQRIRRVLSEPLAVGDLVLRIDASIGVALCPDDGRGVDGLLQRADVAMYTAKEDRSGFALYRRDRDRYSPRRLALFADLRTALDAGALDVAYQPKIALATGTVTGVEALVRWQHDRYGFVPPDEFVPIAEHTDLMLPLTAFVLEAALAQCAAWIREGLEIGVAVNLSPRVLLEPGLTDLVQRLLTETTVAPGSLTLEITEDSVIADPTPTIAVLHRLREMGVRLSIDDFGTGHSSLSYIRDLPVHELKVDKSFILELGPAGDPVVDAAIALAHRLGLEVVAEGIEDVTAYEHLRRIGCETGQGYFISRPLPAQTVADWHAAWAAPASCSEPARRTRLALVETGVPARSHG